MFVPLCAANFCRWLEILTENLVSSEAQL